MRSFPKIKNIISIRSIPLKLEFDEITIKPKNINELVQCTNNYL